MTSRELLRWHNPRLTTVRCANCATTRAYRPWSACPKCGHEGIEEPAAVCAQDEQSWPCPTVCGHPDEAVLAWAADDWGFMAAAHILLNSRLRDKMLPSYLDWSPWRAVARPDWDGLAADEGGHLSGSERFLLQLAANLAHGSTDAGAGLDLTRLWLLDRRHRTVVLTALSNNLSAVR